MMARAASWISGTHFFTTIRAFFLFVCYPLSHVCVCDLASSVSVPAASHTLPLHQVVPHLTSVDCSRTARCSARAPSSSRATTRRCVCCAATPCFTWRVCAILVCSGPASYESSLPFCPKRREFSRVLQLCIIATHRDSRHIFSRECAAHLLLLNAFHFCIYEIGVIILAY